MQPMSYRATVLGASGYSGGELLRLLGAHPDVTVTAASGERRAGEALGSVHPHLIAGVDVTLTSLEDALVAPADVVFSCLPSGALPAHLDRITAALCVDLADDHRGDPAWVYGMTEFARDKLGGAPRIANPGCYPTAVLLALVPFASAGMVAGPVVVDALSGVSGAGRRNEDRLLFGTIDGSVGAYGAIPHRHVAEMEFHLANLGHLETKISFTPHLIPVARGLLATVRARCNVGCDTETVMSLLHDAYEHEAFVHVTEDWPTTKAVAGSNGALVTARVDEGTGWLIACAAIDNLGKGAAGQAVQNANVALGLEEGTGLVAQGVWP